MTMAPSAERRTPKSDKATMSLRPPTTVVKGNTLNSTGASRKSKVPMDRKTIAFAVNYEPSLVDRYYSAATKGVKFTSNSTGTSTGIGSRTSRGTTGSSTEAPTIIQDEDFVASGASSGRATPSNTPTGTRRSLREQKQRSINMTPVKVRYDMEWVPLAERLNQTFWEDIKVWPPRALKDPTPPPPPIMTAPSLPETPVSAPRIQPLPASLAPPPTPVPPAKPPSPLPESVIWKPSKRKDWEDSISELTAVCTSASLRKFQEQQRKMEEYPSTQTAPLGQKFMPPLSREYIKDRIDIDDPLRGYQLRHAKGGWLQGFVLWTNFTTWTHFFTWNSLHPKSGLTSNPSGALVDTDGSLSQELQALPRSGDPSGSGIVFDNVAEIALLGGLGCGELMLRMALEDILKNPQYKYIVLQATNGSRKFYERFGFRRVGAICRYGGSRDKDKNKSKKGLNSNRGGKKTRSSTPNSKTGSLSSTSDSKDASVPTLNTPIQGYRHWTHANESQQSLDLHGGPSYMMCLKLPEEPVEGLNLIENLAACFVDDKPAIEPIGAASTPNPKRKLKQFLANTPRSESMTPPLPSISTPKLSSKSQGTAESPLVNRPPQTPVYSSSTGSPGSQTGPNKRRKVSMDNVDLGGAAMLGGYSPPIHPVVPEVNGYPVFALPPAGMSESGNNGRSADISISSTYYNSPSQVPKGVARIGIQRPAASTKTRPATPSKAAKGKTAHGTNSKPTQSSSGNRKGKTDTGASPSPTVVHHQATIKPGIQKVDRTTLVKQKVKSYPRDRQHYYNKVVQPKENSGPNGPFYFVLHYHEPSQMIVICPMTPKGVLSGKRQGRPRYQCVVEATSSNWITSSTGNYKPVAAFMVMKTPLVAQEAWDVMGEAI